MSNNVKLGNSVYLLVKTCSAEVPADDSIIKFFRGRTTTGKGEFHYIWDVIEESYRYSNFGIIWNFIKKKFEAQRAK